MASGRDSLFDKMYDNFNGRDIDAVFESMTDDVDWPNGWEGGRVAGKEAVRDYWTRQWAEIDPIVTPIEVEDLPNDQASVKVLQVVKDKSGNLIAETTVNHVYTFQGDLIQKMDITEY